MRRPVRPPSEFGLNMTPMIDVVFQLLIFFVCTVEFQRPEDVLEARLPPPRVAGPVAQTSPELDLGRIEVEIAPDRLKVYFQGQSREFAAPESEEGLSQLMRQLQAWTRHEPAIPVHLQGQPEVPTGTMLRVYDACRRAGLADVRLAEEEKRF